MRVVEEFIQGKRPNQDLCEDGIFVSDHFAAVIDGATARSAAVYDGISPGRMAMLKVKEAISFLSSDTNVDVAVDAITEHIATWYKERGIYHDIMLDRQKALCAGAVIYSNYRKEIWQIGDCPAMLDEQPLYNNKIIDETIFNARSLYLQMQLESGAAAEDFIDKGDWDKIFPSLMNIGKFQNNLNGSEYAWETFDGFPVLKERIKVTDVSNAKYIVLASDGYPKLFGTLTESEDYLRYAIDKDPLCFIINKGVKSVKKGDHSFDDRAYIKISL